LDCDINKNLVLHEFKFIKTILE